MSKILLVDDDALLRDTMRQMLELDGHHVTEAPDGRVGLSLCRQARSFDLVITDMLMPELDGAQFIVELRRLHPTMPVLAISGGRRALSPQFNLETAGLLGATRQLSKPFDRAALRASVTESIAAEGIR